MNAYIYAVELVEDNAPMRARDEILKGENTMYDLEGNLQSGLHAQAAANQNAPRPLAAGLNELAAAVHKNAVDHGWWEEERGLPEILMLCVSELAEALEEYRRGRPMLYYPCNAGGVCCDERDTPTTCGSRPYNPDNPKARCSAQSKKPEGVAVELADCVIRILDYCGHTGIDLEEAIRIKHEYNKSRPYRHGGKKC